MQSSVRCLTDEYIPSRRVSSVPSTRKGSRYTTFLFGGVAPFWAAQLCATFARCILVLTRCLCFDGVFWVGPPSRQRLFCRSPFLGFSVFMALPLRFPFCVDSQKWKRRSQTTEVGPYRWQTHTLSVLDCV